MNNLNLIVSCDSRRGIVAAISGVLAESRCNIADSSHFDDGDTGKFFMRVSFVGQTDCQIHTLRTGFVPTAEAFYMTYDFHDEREKLKTVIMVSRFGHCLNDILYRWRIGALPIDIVASSPTIWTIRKSL